MSSTSGISGDQVEGQMNWARNFKGDAATAIGLLLHCESEGKVGLALTIQLAITTLENRFLLGYGYEYLEIIFNR